MITDKSLRSFRRSRTWHENVGSKVRDDSYMHQPGFVYWDGFVITMNIETGKWHLILNGGDRLSDDLEQLEYDLWGFAKDEV